MLGAFGKRAKGRAQDYVYLLSARGLPYLRCLSHRVSCMENTLILVLALVTVACKAGSILLHQLQWEGWCLVNIL